MVGSREIVGAFASWTTEATSVKSVKNQRHANGVAVATGLKVRLSKTRTQRFELMSMALADGLASVHSYRMSQLREGVLMF